MPAEAGRQNSGADACNLERLLPLPYARPHPNSSFRESAIRNSASPPSPGDPLMKYGF